MKNTTNESFTSVPFSWSARKDIPLPMKVIVAYISTRANIEALEWELVAADIVNMWGLPKATVSKVLKQLESQGAIKVAGWRKQARNFPSKIYRIDRSELEKVMNPPAVAVHPGNRRGSSSEPHQFIRGTAPVPPVNLEEEVKEEINKKSLEEEEKSGAGDSECQSVEKPSAAISKRTAVDTFLSKSPKEQVAWLDRIEANKTMEKDLRSGKDVLMTTKFEEFFANF